jgi:hypothetical protein
LQGKQTIYLKGIILDSSEKINEMTEKGRKKSDNRCIKKGEGIALPFF